MSDPVVEALAKAFSEPIHIPAEDFIGKSLAHLFKRQPDMSGDQRNRLLPHERRAVDDLARDLTAALSALSGEVERLKGLQTQVREAVDADLADASELIAAAESRASTAERERDEVVKRLGEGAAVLRLALPIVKSAWFRAGDDDVFESEALKSIRAFLATLDGQTRTTPPREVAENVDFSSTSE